MRAIASNGEQIDVFLIADHLKDRALVRPLAELQARMPAARQNLDLYIGAINENRKKALIEEMLKTAMDKTNSAEHSSTEIAGGLMSSLADLQARRRGAVYDGLGMMRRVVDYLDLVMTQKDRGEPVGLPTGIGKLDRILGGMHKSDLIIVGARPGVGKTAFALTVAVNAARTGKSVGFVSTEMSVEQIGMRVTSLMSFVEASKMRDCSFGDDEWTRIMAAAKTIKDLPLRVLDMPACRVSDIAIQARAWMAMEGLDLIIVDYLTRLRPESNAENRTLAVGEMAADLKTLARSLDIPVLVLSQLSRAVDKRQNPVPNLSDLRDSGVIEQEADQVLMLYRPIVYDDEANEADAEIVVAKNRHGEIATLLVAFDQKTMRWADRAMRGVGGE